MYQFILSLNRGRHYEPYLDARASLYAISWINRSSGMQRCPPSSSVSCRLYLRTWSRRVTPLKHVATKTGRAVSTSKTSSPEYCQLCWGRLTTCACISAKQSSVHSKSSTSFIRDFYRLHTRAHNKARESTSTLTAGWPKRKCNWHAHCAVSRKLSNVVCET